MKEKLFMTSFIIIPIARWLIRGIYFSIPCLMCVAAVAWLPVSIALIQCKLLNILVYLGLYTSLSLLRHVSIPVLGFLIYHIPLSCSAFEWERILILCQNAKSYWGLLFPSRRRRRVLEYLLFLFFLTDSSNSCHNKYSAYCSTSCCYQAFIWD